MSQITKLANLGNRSAITELHERIVQLETQDGPGYGECLKFYKRVLAEAELSERNAFDVGWSLAYENMHKGNPISTDYHINVAWNLSVGLDADGNEK